MTLPKRAYNVVLAADVAAEAKMAKSSVTRAIAAGDLKPGPRIGDTVSPFPEKQQSHKRAKRSLSAPETCRLHRLALLLPAGGVAGTLPIDRRKPWVDHATVLRDLTGASRDAPVGVTKSQVERDLAAVPDGTPATTTGLDGKSYPARKTDKRPAAERATQIAALAAGKIPCTPPVYSSPRVPALCHLPPPTLAARSARTTPCHANYPRNAGLKCPT